MFYVRPAEVNDLSFIADLYRQVAAAGGGIARTSMEITLEYVSKFMGNSAVSGFEFVIENPEIPGTIIGEIHCHKIGPKIFDHVLGELTITVSPDFQGRGVGKLLFTHLLTRIEMERPDILRVELISRESNEKAIAFYKSLGFQIEGRLEKRTRTASNVWEADIPMAWFNKNYIADPGFDV